MAVVYRELEIRFPNGDYHTITGSNIMAESMTITKSICDGNLKLGGARQKNTGGLTGIW